MLQLSLYLNKMKINQTGLVCLVLGAVAEEKLIVAESKRKASRAVLLLFVLC